MLFSRCEVWKMKETESNILKETKHTLVIDSLLLNAWDTGLRVTEIHTDRDVKGLQLTAGVNTNCHSPITFCTDS